MDLKMKKFRLNKKNSKSPGSSFEEKIRFVYMSAICSHAQGYISEKTLLQKKRQWRKTEPS